jgi:hypothetical protein
MTMFLACGGIWGLALVLCLVRGLLGEGCQQRVTLQNAVHVVLPHKARGVEEAANSLLRASEASLQAPETLLHPVSHDEERAFPEQLLRSGHHD